MNTVEAQAEMEKTVPFMAEAIKTPLKNTMAGRDLPSCQDSSRPSLGSRTFLTSPRCLLELSGAPDKFMLAVWLAPICMDLRVHQGSFPRASHISWFAWTSPYWKVLAVEALLQTNVVCFQSLSPAKKFPC